MQLVGTDKHPSRLAARLAWLERVLKFDPDRAARDTAKAEYIALTDPARP